MITIGEGLRTKAHMRVWAKAYRGGVRITLEDGKPRFTRAMHYYGRLEQFRQFGCFPEPVDVAPGQDLLAEIEPVGKELRAWLSKPLPKRYAKYAWHLLALDYELKPLLHHAHTAKVKLGAVCLDGGWVLTKTGYLPDEKQFAKLPTSPINLSNYGEIAV